MNIVIVAVALHKNTLTGGDKIFVECAKRWILWGHKVKILTNEAGYEYCRSNGIPTNAIEYKQMSWIDASGVYLAMIIKTIVSFFWGVTLDFRKTDVVFASSFFLPDILLGLLIMLKHYETRLVTSFYIYTTSLFGSDYSNGRVKGFFFYLNQSLALLLLKLNRGLLLVASQFDMNVFASVHSFDKRRIFAVRGGVDAEFFASIQKQKKNYDAVFVGRFHPQKCVDELIEIWCGVVNEGNTRVLALIGGGLEEEALREIIVQKRLEKNIVFLGMIDGKKKAMILKSSRIFISASRFDTGNIALDEALACGVPGIIYDLPNLEYPKGVVKVPVGNMNRFVQEIIKLLKNNGKRERLGIEAMEFAKTIDWNIRAKQLLHFFASA
ncbi:glycosyltransferase family 4 protein [Candidatus Gottesmanbacteria bacterium]|nr:glycosyltransferase family 4 protein [Candidatus Gottesmanbacteria bacterium]